MENKDLLKRLSKLGFPLFETDADFDVNETLAEVVRSKNMRLWEGFPVLLVNANKKGGFDYNMVDSLLEDNEEKSNFSHLVLLSLSLYRYLHLKFNWVSDLYNRLSLNEKSLVEKFLGHYKKNLDFEVSGQRLNPQRIREMFTNYFEGKKTDERNLKPMPEELSLDLEYALSQVFSPKQKELFLKKLKGEKLTKTEKEYSSRVVKKKATALANFELHTLAKKYLKY